MEESYILRMKGPLPRTAGLRLWEPGWPCRGQMPSPSPMPAPQHMQWCPAQVLHALLTRSRAWRWRAGGGEEYSTQRVPLHLLSSCPLAGPAHIELQTPPQLPRSPPPPQKVALGLWVLGLPLVPSKLALGSSIGLMGWTHARGEGQLARGGGWEGEEEETREG